MPGMDRHTGRSLDGWPHVAQSINDILTTRIATRVQRRPYGSNLPNQIDKPLNEDTLMNLYVEIADALDKWEPRVQLTDIQAVSANSSGQLDFSINVIWLQSGETQTVQVSQ